jgi:hypothetical protein
MTRSELIQKIKENLEWENMEANIWVDNEDSYHLEIMPENATIVDTENYIGKLPLSEWYWGDAEGEELEDSITEEISLLQYLYL